MASSLSCWARKILMVRESLFNGGKEVAGDYRLGQEVIRDRLEGSHRGRDVGMTGKEYNRQRLAKIY